MDRKELEGIFDDKINPLRGDIKQLENLFTGGSDPSKGYHVRIDRLERTNLRHAKVIWTILTAFIGTGIAWGWSKLTGGA